MSNQNLIDEFLEGTGSDRKSVATQNIDGKPVIDGNMAAFFNQEKGIGWTAVAYNNGQFLCRIDLTIDKLSPREVGELVKKIFG